MPTTRSAKSFIRTNISDIAEALQLLTLNGWGVDADILNLINGFSTRTGDGGPTSLSSPNKTIEELNDKPLPFDPQYTDNLNILTPKSGMAVFETDRVKIYDLLGAQMEASDNQVLGVENIISEWLFRDETGQAITGAICGFDDGSRLIVCFTGGVIRQYDYDGFPVEFIGLTGWSFVVSPVPERMEQVTLEVSTTRRTGFVSGGLFYTIELGEVDNVLLRNIYALPDGGFTIIAYGPDTVTTIPLNDPAHLVTGFTDILPNTLLFRGFELFDFASPNGDKGFFTLVKSSGEILCITGRESIFVSGDWNPDAIEVLGAYQFGEEMKDTINLQFPKAIRSPLVNVSENQGKISPAGRWYGHVVPDIIFHESRFNDDNGLFTFVTVGGVFGLFGKFVKSFGAFPGQDTEDRVIMEIDLTEWDAINYGGAKEMDIYFGAGYNGNQFIFTPWTLPQRDFKATSIQGLFRRWMGIKQIMPQFLTG